MSIALVICPNPVLRDPTAHCPLGLLYVARSLQGEGHELRIIDLRNHRTVEDKDIPEADIVGVTATSGEFHFARRVAQIAHQKGAKAMIGGAHATFLPDSCLSDFDYVVKGDGELAACEAIRSGETVPKVYTHPLTVRDMRYQRPAWDLVQERGFSYSLFAGEGYGLSPLAAGIITSRGCAWQCAYCRSKREAVRYRNLIDVWDELKMLRDLWGIRYFRAYDETFTLNRQRTIEFFRMVNKLGIHMRIHTRADAWDDELARAVKRAGVDEVGFGFECASDHVLEKIRKHETVEQYREAVRVCKRAGIICKAFWMIGLPGQGWTEVEEIKRFMDEERPDKWILNLFAPYPGSDVYADPKRYGVTWLDPDLSHYWNFGPEPTLAYADLTAEEIKTQYVHLWNWLDDKFPQRSEIRKSGI